MEILIIVAAYALTCSLAFEVSLLVKRDECRKGWMLIIVAFAPDARGCSDARGCLRRGNWKSRAPCPSVPPTPAPFQTRSRTEGNLLSMSLKYNLGGERNPIISLHGQRCLLRQRRQRTHSPGECSGQYFQHQICQLGRDSKYDKSTRLIEAGV